MKLAVPLRPTLQQLDARSRDAASEVAFAQHCGFFGRISFQEPPTWTATSLRTLQSSNQMAILLKSPGIVSLEYHYCLTTRLCRTRQQSRTERSRGHDLDIHASAASLRHSLFLERPESISPVRITDTGLS